MSDRVQKMERTLIQLEDRLSEIPWDDSAPMMWILHDSLSHEDHTHDGESYCISQVPLQLEDAHSELRMLAISLKAVSILEPSKLDELLLDRSVGLAFSCEAWLNSDMTPEQRQADQRRLADIVGTKEARIVSGVDFSGNGYLISRIRGESVKSNVSLVGDTQKGMGGAVYNSLVSIAQILGSREKALV